MDAKLYIGNLSYQTTEESLRELFGQAGTVVTVDIIKDRDSGRPKGFAFITMSNQQEAQEAIRTLNGKNIDNFALKVSIAKPREERPQQSSFNRRRRY
ncbi:MAG: RNA recognition motif domain-containing protein [Chloroflexota bacterium]